MLSHRNFASLAASSPASSRSARATACSACCRSTTPSSSPAAAPAALARRADHLPRRAQRRAPLRGLKRAASPRMVGVPALWQLLRRPSPQELAPRPRACRRGASRPPMPLLGKLGNARRSTSALFFGRVHKRSAARCGSSSRAAPRSPTSHEALPGLGLRAHRGLRPHRGGAGAHGGRRRSTGCCPGTGRQPMPGVEIRIDDPDEHGVGEVLARGPNVMAGYRATPRRPREVIEDGWLHTGDLGSSTQRAARPRRPPEGHDRHATGENVYPDEVEKLLAQAAVKELSIVGVDDGRGGERVACLACPKDRRQRRLALCAWNAHKRALRDAILRKAPVRQAAVWIIHLYDCAAPAHRDEEGEAHRSTQDAL